MEFQGYALAAVVLLLLAYVAPYLHRRRTVLAEARIDERYAEDLRLLAVRDARVDSPRAHSAIGEHGTVFFRRPEVMMSSLDESADVEHSPARTSAATGTAAQRKPVGTARKGQRRSAKAGEVRSLAKERARRHARISKRAALQKRGLAGGIALGALAIVAWVLALSAASWPVVIAAVATGVVGLYFIGFSYVVGEISSANIRDREAIEDINKKLAGTSRRVAEVAAPSAETHEESEQRATEESRDAAGDQQRVETSEHQGTRAAEGERRTGISVTMDPQIVSSGAIVHGRDEYPVTQPATHTSESERAAALVGRDVAGTSSAMPSYTLKPRTIERRTVAPYQAPAEPEAAVPYRPKQVGERIGNGSDVQKIASEKPAADKLGGGAVLDHLLDRRRA